MRSKPSQPALHLHYVLNQSISWYREFSPWKVHATTLYATYVWQVGDKQAEKKSESTQLNWDFLKDAHCFSVVTRITRVTFTEHTWV